MEAFKEKAKGEETALSFENFLPTPKEFEEIGSPPIIVEEKEYRKKYGEALVERKKEIAGCEAVFTRLPITKKMSDALKKKYGADNWYDWHIANWGTKWDVQAELLCNSELEYHFASAWSPPIKIFEVISKQFPRLVFHMRYDEPGMGFFGAMVATQGLVKDCCEEYPSEE